MLKVLFLLMTAIFLNGCTSSNSESEIQVEIDSEIPEHKQEFAIAIHGGAGFINQETLPEFLKDEYKNKLEEAINVGYEILKNGGNSIDAVAATINILEDSPLFNAGKGAVLNNEERPELDASIMDGKTLNAGAVAGVKHIKNPINLAKEVLENSKHVLLAGEGAEHFAKEQGFKMMPESYFVIEERLNEVRKMKSEDKENVLTSYYDNKLNAPKMGTVGCVALDKNGNLAAGTSTGGLTNKKFGRIGDSPIIGAGTYANNQTCAVSCTGTGEFYIRGAVAYDMSALMEYKNYSVDEAAKEIIHKKQPELGGTGGIIAMDKNGNVSMEFNTPGMFRAKMDDKGNLEIKIFKD